MDKSAILRAFNKLFFEFLDDVISVYPECTEIRATRNALETIRMMNPTSIIRVWYDHVYCRYRSEILDSNIDFFVKKDYGDDLYTWEKNDPIFDKIEKVRSCLISMSSHSKYQAGRYILSISRLSEAWKHLD